MSSPVSPSLDGSSSGVDERLESWKEVAAYLKRGVRTVQRWEQSEALPIHRHRHDKRGTVYAFRQEIDAWRKNRSESSAAVAEAGVALATPSQGLKSSWMDLARSVLPSGWKQRIAVGVAAALILLMWK